MTERKTGRVPPLTDIKAWALLVALILTPPSASTIVLTVKLDGLREAVTSNTESADKNTTAVDGIKVELAKRSAMGELLTDHKKAVGEKLADHEQRIRTIEGK